jgi:hypothetical protein
MGAMGEKRSPNDVQASQSAAGSSGAPSADAGASTQVASGGAPTGPRTLAEQEVTRLWEEFKDGGIARCPRDSAPLALAVDGAAKSYRLVCTRCGNASLWFEIGSAGIHFRNPDDLSGSNLSDD